MKRHLILASVAWLAITPPAAAATLFDDLGGHEGVMRLANVTLDISLDDNRIKDSFSETNMVRLRKLLYEHFCELTGGPCKYTGRSMRRSHAGFEMRDAHFNALAENL